MLAVGCPLLDTSRRISFINFRTWPMGLFPVLPERSVFTNPYQVS